MLLFSDPRDNMKDAKRAIAESMALRGAEKAWNDKDLFMYDKFLGQYVKLNRLDVDDVAGIPSKLRPTIINIITDPKTLKAEAEKLMKNITTVDTEFEEVDEQDSAH